MLKLVIVVFVAALFAGCSISESITMVKGEETRVCGPYTTTGSPSNNNRSLESCVSDYQRQGYNRQ